MDERVRRVEAERRGRRAVRQDIFEVRNLSISEKGVRGDRKS
jgi:hypothetical protein